MPEFKIDGVYRTNEPIIIRAIASQNKKVVHVMQDAIVRFQYHKDTTMLHLADGSTITIDGTYHPRGYQIVDN